MKEKLFWNALLKRYFVRQDIKKLKQFDSSWNIAVFSKKGLKHVQQLLHNCMRGNLKENPFGKFSKLEDVVCWAYERYVFFKEKALQSKTYADCKQAIFYAQVWFVAKQTIARREMCDMLLQRPSFNNSKALK